jgi:hypothetical protein
MEVKFPDVTVELTGQNGNALMIIGLVVRALRRARATQEEVTEFQDEATSGDYDNVIATAMRWVNVT